jgi:hypothetical protein
MQKETSGRKRRLLAAGIVTIILAGGAGAAYAYWTNTGSGTGSGTTGTNAAVTIVQTSTVSAMGPGVAPQALSGTITNPNAGPVYVNNITVSISAVESAPGVPAVGCSAADYAFTNTTTGVPDSTIEVAAQALANDTSTWSGVSIAFVNSASNQDGCKNANVLLSYSSN